jgi:hypothetical protein
LDETQLIGDGFQKASEDELKFVCSADGHGQYRCEATFGGKNAIWVSSNPHLRLEMVLLKGWLESFGRTE